MFHLWRYLQQEAAGTWPLFVQPHSKITTCDHDLNARTNPAIEELRDCPPLERRFKIAAAFDDADLFEQLDHQGLHCEPFASRFAQVMNEGKWGPRLWRRVLPFMSPFRQMSYYAKFGMFAELNRMFPDKIDLSHAMEILTHDTPEIRAWLMPKLSPRNQFNQVYCNMRSLPSAIEWLLSQGIQSNCFSAKELISIGRFDLVDQQSVPEIGFVLTKDMSTEHIVDVVNRFPECERVYLCKVLISLEKFDAAVQLWEHFDVEYTDWPCLDVYAVEWVLERCTPEQLSRLKDLECILCRDLEAARLLRSKGCNNIRLYSAYLDTVFRQENGVDLDLNQELDIGYCESTAQIEELASMGFTAMFTSTGCFAVWRWLSDRGRVAKSIIYPPLGTKADIEWLHTNYVAKRENAATFVRKIVEK